MFSAETIYLTIFHKPDFHFTKVQRVNLTELTVVKAPTNDMLFNLMGGLKLDQGQSRDLIIQLHNCECDAYELLKKLKNIPVPNVFYTQKANYQSLGLLILEDVGRMGRSLSVDASATLEQCKELVRIIANFQTQVNFMEDQSWRQTFVNNYQASDFVYSVVKAIIRPGLECEDKEFANIVQAYFDFDLKELAKFAIEEFSDQKEAFMLCHTDMWANNLFIKLNPDGTFSNEIHSIIDWQAARIGNPLYDCCCFVLLCSDAETRRKHEVEIVDFYYDELCKNYFKHNGSKPAFTREQAHEFYKIAFSQLLTKWREKAESLINRTKAAFEDAQSIWIKCDLAEKCKIKQ